MADDGRPAARWLDAFFTAYYARRPVNATFIGVHEHDGVLPDLSEHGIADTVAEMRALLASAPVPAADAPVPGGAHAQPRAVIDALDVELARGFLEIQIAELESSLFQRTNPTVYTGEAVFGVLSLLLPDFAPAAERLDRAMARMRAIPALLAQARAIRSAPPEWTERALRECAGARALFTDGVRAFAASAALEPRGLEESADLAAAAFADFGRWLSSELRARPSDDCACGEEMLELYLRAGHRLDADADGVLGMARAALVETECTLADRLSALGLAGVAEANARLAEIRPPADAYLQRFGAIYDEMRAFAVDRELVSWPEAPVRFVPRPAWVRAAAPHLYFLFYRSPAAFGRPPVHEHLVLPIDGTEPPEKRAALLRASNDAVIRLNHVVHHAGLGHHVQNAHAYRSPSRIGRVAAVDCASRIAMFCGGTMAEGWACYATTLMAELGALAPLEEIAELQSTARMCVRAIVDVELHRGRMSLEGASAAYVERAGMTPDAARAEAVKNSMNPGAALMYLAGTLGIREMRRAAAARAGSTFALRHFHDDLLSWGSVPVTAIARRMADHAL